MIVRISFISKILRPLAVDLHNALHYLQATGLWPSLPMYQANILYLEASGRASAVLFLFLYHGLGGTVGMKPSTQ